MNILKIKIIFTHVIWGLILSLFMVSCEDDPSAEFNASSLDQLFRPVSIEADVNATTVILTWAPTSNSYVLEISKDTLLFTNDLKTYSIEGTSQITFENLWSNTLYSVRIKSISDDPNVKDSEFQMKTFLTKTENIFYSVPAEEIGTDQVLLKWMKDKDVTHIVVSTEGLSDRIINLSAQDKSSGQKTIDGLSSNTSYSFKIYLNEMLRGTISLMTN